MSSPRSFQMAESQSDGPEILVENVSLNDEVRYNVLTKQWTNIHSFKFPTRYVSLHRTSMRADNFVYKYRL